MTSARERAAALMTAWREEWPEEFAELEGTDAGGDLESAIEIAIQAAIDEERRECAEACARYVRDQRAAAAVEEAAGQYQDASEHETAALAAERLGYVLRARGSK